MGGFGSGRGVGRPVVEEGLTLDLDYLRRLGRSDGGLQWSRRGEAVAEISWRLDLWKALLTLSYAVGPDREDVKQEIQLTTTEPHFGGVRWWMLCPLSRRRCTKLYLRPGFNRFASREALGLAYRSQSESHTERAARRSRKIQERLGATGDLDAVLYLSKPKWMRWATYEREVTKALHARAQWYRGLEAIVGLTD